MADALRVQADGDAAKADVAKGEDQGEVVVARAVRRLARPRPLLPVTPLRFNDERPSMSSRATCSARSATAPPASPSAVRSAAGSWPISPGRASWSRRPDPAEPPAFDRPPTADPPRRRKEPSCPPRSLDSGWPCPLRPDQRGPGGAGRHQRPVDHRAHRDQGAPGRGQGRLDGAARQAGRRAGPEGRRHRRRRRRPGDGGHGHPDYTLPSAACILQLELGMTRARPWT